ncbi:Protein lsb5 [Rhizoctonia solani AG-1 IB]|uniref:Protein lsb5 n=1 Tax=Thanatephorus cucumeris (strain AG1-IB / isolate 7/3/14) TaxID=1108050 RepID=M5C3X1_THACB|nr:Protein lsb5 [Rhizoctonia solani AG-1 IB]
MTTSTLGLAKHALNTLTGEKPHSSITDWIEILSKEQYKEDDYDGAAEASRAIRKKLKYGNVHRQLRALTMLKALVENCGPKFQSTFANDQLVDRIKLMSQDPMTDEHVKRKLMSVLASWHRQFKEDPKMHTVSNLYLQCGGGKKATPAQTTTSPRPHAETLYEQHQRRAEEEARARAERKAKEREAKEEEKRKLKEEKLAAKERERKARTQPARKPFVYETEKPKILQTIAEASQASTNLLNAVKRVNREQESVTTNADVQECLATAKAVRKQLIRYIQLAIQKEEIIGTLLDTNERIIAAIQLYDRMSKSPDHDSDEEIRQTLASTAIGDKPPAGTTPRNDHDTELEKLQLRQRARIQREISRSSLRSGLTAGAVGAGAGAAGAAALHPDLQDLAWGGASSSNLQAPMQPAGQDSTTDAYTNRGSLSDFSDYDSNISAAQLSAYRRR